MTNIQEDTTDPTDTEAPPSGGTQLEFKDSLTIETTKDSLWPILSNPSVLVACVPGAETIEQVSERRYTVEVTRGISSLSISLAGQVEIVELHEPDWMLVEGSAYDSRTHTDFEGTAALELEQVNDDSVELIYKAYLTFSGGSGSLSPRVLRTIVKSDVNRYFENLRSKLEHPDRGR